jgi:hypothetical protein
VFRHTPSDIIAELKFSDDGQRLEVVGRLQNTLGWDKVLAYSY